MTDTQLQSVGTVFDKFSVDDRLHVEFFEPAMKAAGYEPTREQVDKLVTALNLGLRMTMHFDEFTKAVSWLHEFTASAVASLTYEEADEQINILKTDIEKFMAE